MHVLARPIGGAHQLHALCSRLSKHPIGKVLGNDDLSP